MKFEDVLRLHLHFTRVEAQVRLMYKPSVAEGVQVVSRDCIRDDGVCFLRYPNVFCRPEVWKKAKKKFLAWGKHVVVYVCIDKKAQKHVFNENAPGETFFFVYFPSRGKIFRLYKSSMLL